MALPSAPSGRGLHRLIHRDAEPVHGLLQLAEGSRGLVAAVQAFKLLSTRRASRGVLWQRGYYDHVVRREDDLDRIRAYILDNPARWSSDHENPDRPT